MPITTVQNIKDRAQRLFGDADGIQIVDQDFINWANDAQEEIFNQLDGYSYSEVTQNLVANVADNPYTLPTNMVEILGVYAKRDPASTSYYPLRRLSRVETDFYLPGYRGGDYGFGTPIFWALGPNSTLRIFPNSDTAITNGLMVAYSSTPVALTALTDNLTVPTYLRQAVFDYVMMRCYEQDEDWDSADRKSKSFQDTLSVYAERHKAFSEYPHITVTTGDYYD